MANIFLFISPHFPDSYYQFVAALKKRGFITLGIGSAPYYEIPEGLKSCIDEYYCCHDMDDFENEKIAVEYFIKKYGHIDYIESNSDYWLEKDAELREIYNIPHGPRPNELANFHHKSLMKKYYEKAGVPVARWTIVTSLSGLIKFARKVHYPIFTKPDNGVGAIDDHKIHNEDELIDFYTHKEEGATYIAEEFIEGELVSFDGISNSKGEVIFCCGHEYSTGISDVVANPNLDVFYYTVKEIDPKLKDAGCRVIKAFDVKNRFFHCEFFRLTKFNRHFGRKGDYVALEVNMRPAGGYTPDLIDFSQSVSCYEIYGDSIAYDENRQDMSKEKYFAACASRRKVDKYLHTVEEINYKYYFSMCLAKDYPPIFSDDMGDMFFMAKFSTKEEVEEFHSFVNDLK
ncbi:MAG: ATP-grasp domain-containing protein [Coprobacillus sp.]|nr:ATP-grasp domain-containing protein [Coprobacillus sp.]